MTWFKVDDKFAFHPKVVSCPLTAIGLWVRAGAWCAGNLTDGALPAHMLRTLGAQKRDADRLVQAGLWCATDEGYQFVDWHEWQPTKEQVNAERESNKARQQAWRDRNRNAVRNGVTNDVTNSAPTRPDPSLTTKNPPTPQRGTRLSADWTPSEDDVSYARQQGLAAGVVDRVAADFRDYWLSKAGQGATKTDWSRTWQGWVRREADRRGKVSSLPGSNGYVSPSKRLPAAWR